MTHRSVVMHDTDGGCAPCDATDLHAQSFSDSEACPSSSSSSSSSTGFTPRSAMPASSTKRLEHLRSPGLSSAIPSSVYSNAVGTLIPPCRGGISRKRERRAASSTSSSSSSLSTSFSSSKNLAVSSAHAASCRRRLRRCAMFRRCIREALRDGSGSSIDWRAIVDIAQNAELSLSEHNSILSSAVLWGIDDGFRSVLSVAVEEDREEYVGLFLARGADPNRVAAWHEDTPLVICASFRGSVTIARMLLAHGANVEGVGVPDVPCCEPPKSISALGCAAYRGHLALVRLLLQNGADPNYVEAVDGCSILHFAAQGSHRDSSSHREICEVLAFDYFVDPDAKDLHGNSPADLADIAGDRSLAEFLTNCKTLRGATLLLSTSPDSTSGSE